MRRCRVSRMHVGVVLTGLREPRGPWGPGRPVEAADAFEAVRVDRPRLPVSKYGCGPRSTCRGIRVGAPR